MEVRLELQDDAPNIEADPGQFQQVLMNLVINAAEAIGEDRPGMVQTGRALAQDPRNRGKAEKASSIFDIRQRLVVGYVWDNCGPRPNAAHRGARVAFNWRW